MQQAQLQERINNEDKTMFIRFCKQTSNGDLKRGYSWNNSSESGTRRTDEAEVISGTEERTTSDDDENTLKENGCAVQAVDLVADCPEAVESSSSRAVSPADDNRSPPASPSMGQRPSSLGLLRPKISLTWVLRGQHQQHQHLNGLGCTLNNQQPLPNELHREKDTNHVKEREEKERVFRRSVKSAKSVKSVKSVKNNAGSRSKERDKENIDRLEKHERKSESLHRVDKVEKTDKPAEKDRLNEVSTENALEKRLEKDYQVIKESKDNKEKVKRAISEPNLISRDANCTPSGREKHRHRRTKRSHRPKTPSKFGYEIADLDSFLTKASIERPANIPVVLSFPSVLYQTQGGTQAELALPLGTVVNAVFKNQSWLYVQTPHGQEGYVSYAACLPLGILPQPTRGPCWEDSTDVFPRPLGNLTDTEKLRDTRSECGDGSGSKRSTRARRAQSAVPREPSVERQLYLRAAASCRVRGARHTLLLVREDHKAPEDSPLALSVTKGDVVALLGDCASPDCFWVRTRDGREGFIPAAVAGHGFL